MTSVLPALVTPPSVFQLASRALAVNIFFKRSFVASAHLPQVAALLSASFLGDGPSLLATSAVLHSTFQKPLVEWIPGIPNADSHDILNFSVLFSFFLLQSSFLTLLHSSSFPNRLLWLSWPAVPTLAVLQLARKPLWLKSYLRPLRVAMGPVSILTAFTLGVEQAVHAPLGSIIAEMGALCALCSLAAGFIFRPDNTQLLDCFVQKTPPIKQRARIHGILNIVATTLALILCFGISR